MEISKSLLKDLTYQINGAAIEVHKHLGPGLLESVYHQCLKHELTLRNIKFLSEMMVPVTYKGTDIMTDLRCDLLIERCIVVELKAIESVLPIHEVKLLTYKKLIKAPKGILINFNTTNLYHEGQKTFVNEFFASLKDK